ncbi:GSH-induced LITAF domain protein [Wolffia australiana]
MGGEPAYGVPIGYQQTVAPPPQQVFYVAPPPHQAGLIPPNAVYGDPRGMPIHQTMYRDTPAPFNCAFCGSSGLTVVRSKISLAALVGCMAPFMLGFCFLCPCTDCLWHKYHYCPHCSEKVGEFEKSDIFIVADPPNWIQQSFAIPS